MSDRSKELGISDDWMGAWPDTGKGRALAIESWIRLRAKQGSCFGRKLAPPGETDLLAWGEFPVSIVFEGKMFEFLNHGAAGCAIYSFTIGLESPTLKTFALEEALQLAFMPQAKVPSFEELKDLLGVGI